MKNILVTGSDGYIGSGLYKKLIDSGHKIKAVDRKIFFDLDKVYNDINRPVNNFVDIKKEHLDGVDHVIHLAAISNDPLAEIDSRLTWETNVLYTQLLIENCIKANVSQFTFASSGSVYGLKEEEKVTEDLDLVPITDYNKSKMCAERILLSYKDKIGLSIIRPATVCGTSSRQRLDVVVNILTYQALTKGSINLFGGEQVRPHIHINDMHSLYIEIINYPQKYQGIFNAGFENIKNRDLANMISEKVGAKINKTESADNRSYRLSSEKLLLAGFKPQYKVSDAIDDLVEAYNSKNLVDGPQTNSVKWLKENKSNIL